MTNLFEKMGLETRLTRASRDGGVDCVAYDMRPVIGDKVIIQAKRYRRTVGVSAVRDLFGTLHNEGAAKGILFATSGYGKSAYELRPGLKIQDYLKLVRLLENDMNYRIACVRAAGGEVLAVAGFRLCRSLAWGRFLYVDELSTKEGSRSKGLTFGCPLE